MAKFEEEIVRIQKEQQQIARPQAAAEVRLQVRGGRVREVLQSAPARGESWGVRGVGGDVGGVGGIHAQGRKHGCSGDAGQAGWEAGREGIIAHNRIAELERALAVSRAELAAAQQIGIFFLYSSRVSFVRSTRYFLPNCRALNLTLRNSIIVKAGYVHVYTHTHMYKYTYIYICIFIHTHTHTHMYICICICICMYICMYIYVYIYIRCVNIYSSKQGFALLHCCGTTAILTTREVHILKSTPCSDVI